MLDAIGAQKNGQAGAGGGKTQGQLRQDPETGPDGRLAFGARDALVHSISDRSFKYLI